MGDIAAMSESNQENIFSVKFEGSGLYPLGKTIRANKIIVYTDATYIGRLGLGIGVDLPTAISKSPAFCHTSNPRRSISGQVLPCLAGIAYREISLDTRYRIDRFIMDEIIKGYEMAGKGFPFFITLDGEKHRIPFSEKLYAIDTRQQRLIFESSVKDFLFSRRFNFRECF